MARLSIVQQQMKEMLDHHSHLKDINLEDIALPKEQDTTTNSVDIMPQTPPYFKIASLKSINSGTINLEIKSSLVPFVCVVTGAELILSHHDFYKSCLGSNHHLLDAALTCPMAQFVVYVHQRLSVRLMLKDSMRILKPY